MIITMPDLQKSIKKGTLLVCILPFLFPLLIVSSEGVLRQWLWENKLLEDFLIRAVIRGGSVSSPCFAVRKKAKNKRQKGSKIVLVGLQAEVGTYYVCMKNIGDMPMMIASLYVPEMLLACLLLVTSLLIIALVVPRLSRRILNGQRLQDHCPEVST